MFGQKTTICFLAFALVGLVGCSGSQTKPIQSHNAVKPFDPNRFIVAGSGTNLPVTVKLAEAYTKKYGRSVEIRPALELVEQSLRLTPGRWSWG